MNGKLAPVVLFVFNRLDHTKETVKKLQGNFGSEDTSLYIYSDAARKDEEKENVNAVREFIDSITGFKSITIIKHEYNYGLANNIMLGVNAVCKEHGRVIVLEDDIVTSPCFLNYMNKALDFYMENKKIWHISGWNYPIDDCSLPNVFAWRVMNCWGWGTWDDRWQHFEKKPDEIISTWSRKKIKKFNLDGNCNFWQQIVDNHNGKLNTWAVFWYATIFDKKGLCINPSVSFVNNIGRDGSGQNCGNRRDTLVSKLNERKDFEFNVESEENKTALNLIKEFYKSQTVPFYQRVINKILRVLKL